MSPDRPPLDDELSDQQLVLGDLLNRVLDKGIVISGQVTISVADIDLVALDLRILLSSIQTMLQRPIQSTPPRGDIPILPPASHEPQR